ncbi:MAG TPA: hypothetical protein VJ837_05125 [Candidatus Paceibacterota bacterium]|nr:hypothetical protein [Candidatus Paceibacterota bacterium]
MATVTTISTNVKPRRVASDGAENPKSKIQVPNKFQVPNERERFEAASATFGICIIGACLGFGFWILEFLILEFGISRLKATL